MTFVDPMTAEDWRRWRSFSDYMRALEAPKPDDGQGVPRLSSAAIPVAVARRPTLTLRLRKARSGR